MKEEEPLRSMRCPMCGNHINVTRVQDTGSSVIMEEHWCSKN